MIPISPLSSDSVPEIAFALQPILSHMKYSAVQHVIPCHSKNMFFSQNPQSLGRCEALPQRYRALMCSPSFEPCLESGYEKFSSLSLSSSVDLPLASHRRGVFFLPPLQQLACPLPHSASGPGVPTKCVADSRCALQKQGGHATSGRAATQNCNCPRCDISRPRNSELSH